MRGEGGGGGGAKGGGKEGGTRPTFPGLPTFSTFWDLSEHFDFGLFVDVRLFT